MYLLLVLMDFEMWKDRGHVIQLAVRHCLSTTPSRIFEAKIWSFTFTSRMQHHHHHHHPNHHRITAILYYSTTKFLFIIRSLTIIEFKCSIKLQHHVFLNLKMVLAGHSTKLWREVVKNFSNEKILKSAKIEIYWERWTYNIKIERLFAWEWGAKCVWCGSE